MCGKHIRSLSVVELCIILLGHRFNQASVTIPLDKTTQCRTPEGKAWSWTEQVATASSLLLVMIVNDGGGVAYESGTSLGATECLSLCMFCCFWDETPNISFLTVSVHHLRETL